MHHSKPHTKISTLSDFIWYFSCIWWFIFSWMTLKLERATTRTQKRLKLGMVSSFDQRNMCAKVARITAKTGCTSCTNWTISFKVQGFQTKTHLLQRHFIFLSLFQLKTYFASNMQHSKPHTEISTLSDFICYFSCI